jgi:energy-coupling factor transporter transmembrane protein EcfT
MTTIRISYYQGVRSFLSELDPRTKLIYILWVFAMIMVFTNPVYQSFTIATLLLAIYAGNLSLKKVIKFGQLGIYVGVASWLLWIIFLRDSGSTLFTIFGWHITDIGVYKGLAVSLRITSVLFAFLIAAMATPTRGIITGLYQLKISVVFSMVVGIVLRLIPQFQAEHGIIMEAQKSRATEFDKGGLMARFRKHTAYIIPLTLRALKIVSDLSIAMESRAFDPYGTRTFVNESKFSRTDKIILILMGGLLVASILLRIFGFGGLAIAGFATGQ